MAFPEVAVPKTPGRPVVFPAPREWIDLAYANQARGFAWQFSVAGVPYAELAGRTRRRALEESSRYTRELDGSIAPQAPVAFAPDHGQPIVVSGHQPGFWHPGVWFKTALLHCCASTGRVVGLNVVVDSDALPAITVDVPVRDGGGASDATAESGTAGKVGTDFGRAAGRLRRTRDMLLAFGREVPFELMAAPGPDEISQWLARVGVRVGTLRNQAIARTVGEFGAAALAAARVAQARRWSFADFATAARRGYERKWGRPAYTELPLSVICGFPEFRHFMLDFVERRQGFTRVHNAALAGFRHERGLGGRPEPFPDLRRAAGEWWELPFWVLDSVERSRRPLSVALSGSSGELCLLAGLPEDSAAGVLLCLVDDTSPAGRAENLRRLGESGLAIRPKAVALTMFLRLFVADIFVHGVGGAGYDAVTDEIIRRFYGVEAPRYAVASTTRWLPEPVDDGGDANAIDGLDSIGGGDPGDAEIRALLALLRDLEFNPDRRLSPANAGRPEVIELVEQKQELIGEINLTSDRARRRMLGREIRRTNARLAALLEAEREAAERRLAAATRRAAETRAACFREYPLFLFDPDEILIEAQAMWTKGDTGLPWC